MLAHRDNVDMSLACCVDERHGSSGSAFILALFDCRIVREPLAVSLALPKSVKNDNHGLATAIIQRISV
jgi:hypothetical protein